MPTEYSAEWAKVPDGNGGTRKVWLRDSKARKAIDELSALLAESTYERAGGITMNSAFSAAQLQDFAIKKIGKIAYISGSIGNLALASGANTVGTIVSDCTPAAAVFTQGYIGTSASVGTAVRIAIGTDGVVKIMSPSAVTSTLRFSASFITN